MLREVCEIIHQYEYSDNDNEYSSVIHILNIPVSFAEDKKVARAKIENDPEFGCFDTGCSHEYDCCGCWFRCGYQLYYLDTFAGSHQFMLERSYSRNY